MNEEKKTIVVGAKVTMEANMILEKVARSLGITKHELFMMAVESLVRYTCPQFNRTPEMERAMSCFEHMQGWKDAFNLVDSATEPYIVAATYYMTSKGKKTVRAVHLEQPLFGDWKQTYNVQTIFEQALCNLSPERYKRMRVIMGECGCGSLLEVIDILIDRYTQGADMDELRSGFEDNARSDFGNIPPTRPFVRHHAATMDMFEAQQERERRSEEARKKLEGDNDYKPFGYEW